MHSKPDRTVSLREDVKWKEEMKGIEREKRLSKKRKEYDEEGWRRRRVFGSFFLGQSAKIPRQPNKALDYPVSAPSSDSVFISLDGRYFIPC